MGLLDGVTILSSTGSVDGGNLFKISHRSRRLLLDVSSCGTTLWIDVLLDKWVVDYGWGLDHQFIGYLSQLLVAGVGIYHPEWIATTWQTYLIFLAVTAFATGFGIFFNELLPLADVLSAVWTLLGMIVMLICLSVKAASGRRPASFALGAFDPSASGW
ncbi:hypothetical protein AGABI1DRAFT_109464, partial [Agaricus bisporus var. burnettii JB137-S8]